MLEVQCSTDVEKYLEDIIRKQESLFLSVVERIKEAQKKQKEQYKRRKVTVDYSFKISDEVLRRNMLQKTRKGNKDEHRWMGPFTILELTSTSCLLKIKQVF